MPNYPKFRPHKRKFLQELDVQMCKAENKILVFDASQNFATEPSQRCNTAAARRFFKRAVGTNGVPDRIAIDKSSANLAGLQSLNVILKFTEVS